MVALQRDANKSNNTIVWLLKQILIVGCLVVLIWHVNNKSNNSNSINTTTNKSSSSSLNTPASSNDRRAILLPDRLAQATIRAARLAQTSSWLELHCPTPQQVGGRPPGHTAQLIGTTCEPWIHRGIATVLMGVLDSTNMIGLEWSSGSGTAWLLRVGLKQLYSIEHCQDWLKEIQQKIQWATDINGNSEKTWFPYHVPRADGKGCDQTEDLDFAKADAVFGDYARYPRQKNLLKNGNYFDFVSVDGRHRDGCLLEAAGLLAATTSKSTSSSSSSSSSSQHETMLVRPDYGILMLDNAERPQYVAPRQLPSHWLCVSFAHGVSETTLWMTCPTKDDAQCTMARAQIHQAMWNSKSNQYKPFVGRRYKEHMAQAKRDGVPMQ